MSTGLTSPTEDFALVETPSRQCIHEVFQRQAQQAPDGIALSFGPEHLSYRRLNEEANRLAHYLRELGVGPEVPVALYLDRTPKMVMAILAVLKAGGTYVPVDLAYPRERLAFMLADSAAKVVLTQENLRSAFSAQSPQVFCMDSDWAKLAGESVENPLNSASSNNAAYIIYTSGSTGKPKGVVVTHHNVVRLLKSTAHWYGFNTSDVWPLFHSYAFDVSVWELWGSLFHGGRLIVVPYLVTRTPAEFYELLAREKVTVLNQTPSAFRQLIWAEETAAIKRELSLRCVICAGEALELQSLKPWFDRHGDQKPKVVNMYGITETTVHSTYRVIRREDLENGAGSVIGVPIPDLQLYLVDEDLKPVPAGVPGEICIGGSGVARGYLNRPELTTKRFLPDPFSLEAGARLYRSGDLAQVNAHGEVEYLGRMDHQVKIRGFRVELGEIESALNRHEAIRETVVIAKDDPSGGKRLVAYVVPDGRTPTVTDLRDYLAPKLPDYMLPAVFVFLPKLPLTTNGKVDRRALPEPETTRPCLNTQYVAPRTQAEEILAGIWGQVLGVEQVGIHDNFFELGGDSIRSIVILSKARELGVHRSLEQIFQHPTVAGLAACAEPEKVSRPSQPAAPFSLISAEDRAHLSADAEDAYPITRLQLGMFYYNELDPVSAIYHDVFSYRVQAPFEQAALQRAILRLAQRHPLLRTSFHLAGFTQPLQVVHREVAVPFTVEDLSGLPAASQDQRLKDWIEAEKRRPFSRAIAPLFRFHAQIRDDRAFQLILSFHHSCLDGWSLAAVITELLQDYSALRDGTPSSIEAPKVAYRDFVALEQQALQSEATRSFWRAQFEGAAPQVLPRWPKALREGGHEQKRGPELLVDEKVFSGLKALAQTAGVPLKTVLLAAHQRVMSLLHGQPEVLSGLVCNGRPEQTDAEKLVGLFLNTVPLRQTLSGGTWLELVRQTFAAEQQIMPHRRFPLAEIQKLNGGQPLFETAFDFVHFHVYKHLRASGNIDLAEGHYFEANNLTTYTTFILDVNSARLELHLDYDPNALCREQVEQISAYYLKALEAMATQPSARYEQAMLLSDSESHRLLVEWNSTAEDYPRDKGIPDLVNEHARQNPDAVALVCGSQKWSYAELERRVNDLTEALRRRNIGPGVLVGLCVERCAEMVAALLAILKTGAAYVPLDPTYPKARLEYMMNDAALGLLITQQPLTSGLPDTKAPLLFLDSPETASGQGRAPRQTEPAPGGLAYVIYTSGSTGKPKGVEVYHRAVVNLVRSVARKTGFTSRDNLLAVTTLSFDIAALELYLPLIQGGTLTLATREEAADGTRLAQLLESRGATFMQGTPATWRLLLESGWTGNQALTVFCGGEALKRDLADSLLSRAKSVWNFYGPTETTIWSSAWKVQPGESVSIGRPLANTQFYILDAQLRPVPVGTAGELYIGGEGLARGYLKRPELTGEKFLPHPFSKADGARIYRTGDLARYWPDGNIECLGRVDHQVKVRGFRIELGEVESALRQNPGVAGALVTAREDALGEKRLVGYVISKNGPPSHVELRDFLKARLPLYMVPSQFVFLERFPLTPNGKIDLRQLPAPEGKAAPAGHYQPPRDATEEQVTQIWQEVLLLTKISSEENFFELGGDSLSATRVFARINRAFGTNLSLRAILEHPTVRALAGLIAQAKDRNQSNAPVIPRQPRRAGNPARL